MPRTVSTKLSDETSQRPATNCETPACGRSHWRDRLRWQSSAFEVQRPVGLSCHEKSALKHGFNDRHLFSIGDSLARKGGRAYFPTEPHRLSVTFGRTRPSDTPVNGVNIWLRQRTTLNARVKTPAIYSHNGKRSRKTANVGYLVNCFI